MKRTLSETPMTEPASSTLVERLTAVPDYFVILPTLGAPDQIKIGELVHEAAARITELESEVERWRSLYDGQNTLLASQAQQITDCRTINDGLRERVRAETIEVRRDDGGSIDEVVAKNCDLHIEQLSDSDWFVAVTAGNGDYIQFNLGAKHGRAHVAMIETDSLPAPPQQKTDATPTTTDGDRG